MRAFVWMLLTAIAAGVAFYVLREHWGHSSGSRPISCSWRVRSCICSCTGATVTIMGPRRATRNSR